MKFKSAFCVVLIAVSFYGAQTLSGRGFGGGFGGGGGGFHGGGGFGGGGGGFGGGGFHGGGDFGGGGYHGGGDFGGGGYHGGGDFGGGAYHSDFAGDAGRFGSGGFNNSGIGGLNGGDGIRGSGGMAGDGFRGAGGFGSLDGRRSGSLPTAGQLNSFLGLPTDMGIHSAGSMEHPYGYSGDAHGLSAFDPISSGMRNSTGHDFSGDGDASFAHGSTEDRGAAFGSEGAAAGERGARGTVAEGPNGTTIAHGAAGERGAAVGPGGAAAGERGVSGTVVKGPNGTTVAHASAGERGAAVGPNGAVGGARGVSGTAVRGPDGNVAVHGSEVTHGWSAADMRVQGNFARSNFHDYNAFGRGWYGQHPGAWRAYGYGAGIWTAADWAAVNGWFGSDWPIYGYNYGNDLTYVNNNVYLYDQPIATADDYYQSAVDLAQTGVQAQVLNDSPPASNAQPNAKTAKWLPLGVFEAVPAGEKSSKMLMQLAVNKAGVIRGNYYNTGDQNVQVIEGSVDKKTARAAWVVADKKDVIFDTGLYNLTKPESSILVHFGKDKNEQWELVRMNPPKDETTQK